MLPTGRRCGSALHHYEYLLAARRPADPCLGRSEPEGDFGRDGFVRLGRLVSPEVAAELAARLERVIRGEYSTGQPPDKRPKRPATGTRLLGWNGRVDGQRTIQLINCWKADSLFAAVARSPVLGRLVAQLAGWRSGARLAQDQVWAKPPGAPPLVYHRDSPYFDFEPAEVLTVWLALDRMDPELGPLQYVRGSHRWGDGRSGSANQFFDPDSHALVRSAAEREGLDPDGLEYVSMAGLPAGGASVHNGRTWHGSGPNQSDREPRRGLGIHFVPACSKWRPADQLPNGRLGKLWAPFKMEGTDELPDDEFPVTWAGPG